MNTAPAATRTVTTGIHQPRISSSRKPPRILARSGEENTTNWVCTSGILAAGANPAWTRAVFTRSTIGPMSITTSSFFSTTAPPPSPVRALTMVACPARTASSQTVAKASLVTTRSAAECTRLVSAPSSGPVRPPSSWASRGGTPCSAAAWDRSFTRALTSTCSVAASVIRLARAFWTSGLWASGAMVATNRSVSVISSWAQTAMTASSDSTDATTTRTTEPVVRSRWCSFLPRASASSSATRRCSASSSALSGRSGCEGPGCEGSGCAGPGSVGGMGAAPRSGRPGVGGRPGRTGGAGGANTGAPSQGPRAALGEQG